MNSADSSPPQRRRGIWPVLEERALAIDVRWLALFRILFGTLLCVELLRRWAAVGEFFSNEGVLSNHFSLFRPIGPGAFSLYSAFSSSTQVSVAFGATLIVFVAFTVGYRTRIAHVLSFVCIASLNARNLMVENGGTVAVNLLCFWTLFLPLGRRLSVDALLGSLESVRETGPMELNAARELRPVEPKFYSLATTALLLQWSVIYFFNCITKTGKGWMDGSALHYFLHQDRIVTPFGVWLREQAPGSLLQGLTYATLVVEGLLPVLILLPFWQGKSRRLALVLAVGLHGSIALTARLGPFSYVMSLFFLLLLGDAEWRWLKRLLGSNRPSLQLIYDDDCGVCLQACRLLRRLDSWRCLSFAGACSFDSLPKGVDDALLDQTMVVVLDSGEIVTHERAVSTVLKSLPLAALGLGWVTSLPGVRRLVRALYRRFANRRHEVSAYLGWGQCGIADSSRQVEAKGSAPAEQGMPRFKGKGLLRESLVVVALVMFVNQVAIDNAAVRQRVRTTQPAAIAAWVSTFRLMQGWRMFAPEPPYTDGRLVVDARTSDGRQVDPLTGELPDFETETRSGWGLNQFWCDFHLKMSFPNYRPYHSEFRDYLRRWPERTGRAEDRLVAFDVWWVHDKSPPPGQAHGEPQKPRKLFGYGRVADSRAPNSTPNIH